MDPLLTRAEARAFDQSAVERGVASLLLMENAGRGAVDAMVARGFDLSGAVIVGGVGQNGGDGWVIARRLLTLGFSPRVIIVGDPAYVSGDAAENLRALQKLVPLEVARDGFAASLAEHSVVVDALFGTGLSRPLRGVYLEAVDAIAQVERARVVALDLPSGVHADTGAVLPRAAHAALTVTFAAHKRGLHQYPGADFTGEVVVVDIGVPAPDAGDAWLLRRDDVVAIPRAGDAHKGTAGHCVVVGGGEGKVGAALLAAHGAYRAGAGYVTVTSRAEARAAIDARVVEVMSAAPDDVVAFVEGKGACVVGPGLGLGEEERGLALTLAKTVPNATVLDADALTAIAEDDGLEMLKSAPPRVLTPHPKEAARLLRCETREVQANRFAAARAIAERSGQVVILKGAKTIVATAGEPPRVVPFGTPAMGVAGSGDVLAGITAAFLGQRSGTGAAFESATQGALVHALAGERAAIGDRGLLAREIADAVPRVLAGCVA